MSAFQYTPVSGPFLDQLTARVAAGDSVVLLGPRHCGKRYVLQTLVERLRQLDIGAVVPLCDLPDVRPATDSALEAAIRAAIMEPAGIHLTDSADLLDSLSELYRKMGKPVFLIAANIDGMPHHISRRFLQALRAKVLAKEVIAVLTGEYDFRDLVHGPGSDFNVALQYVIQGLDRYLFRNVLRGYCQQLSFEIDCSEESSDYLCKLTGGSIYLLRLLLVQAVENRVRGDPNAVRTLRADHFPLSSHPGGATPADAGHLLPQAVRMIAREAACWPQLEKLLSQPDSEIPVCDGRPGVLEFAGFTRRDPERRTIAFSSPIMRDLALAYYDPRRLADLHALGGQWDQAFERYTSLDPRLLVRPTNAADKTDVEAIVNALGSSLHSEGSTDGTPTKTRFANGCRLVLGFPEVSYWRVSKSWVCEDSDGISSELKKVIPKMIPQGGCMHAGLLPLPEPYDSYALAAIFPSVRSGEQEGVIVGDFRECTPISRERLRFTTKLLEVFVEAQTNIVAAEANRIRLRVRDTHVEVIQSIFGSLDHRLLDVNLVLRMAGEGLRRLGYHRVSLCFVDPLRRRIAGVVDLSDDSRVNVAEMTDWPLGGAEEAKADIQPYVIFTRESKIIPVPADEPMINKEVDRRARLRPLAIVPILNRDGIAIGTIHIERRDSTVPTREEVEDLDFFGRQLASAIEHSEHVRLLRAALDKNTNATVLFGLDQKPLYVNHPAAKLLDMPAGWVVDSETAPLCETLPGETAEAIARLISDGPPSTFHVHSLGKAAAYRGLVGVDPIQNWLGQVTAGILRVQDLDYIEKVFDASIRMAGATDEQTGIRCLVLESLKLGPTWVRLYWVSENDPDILVSRLWEGEGNEKCKARFNSGELKLHRHYEPNSAWAALQEHEPKVYYYRPDLRDGDTVFTERGLPATVATTLTRTDLFSRDPGAYWIDFPLYTHGGELDTPGKDLGKLTLDCKPDFSPEFFEFIKVLCGHTSSLLDSFAVRTKQLVFASGEAADKSIAMLAHNLATRIASLPGILRRYRKLEESHPDLLPLNDDFRSLLENALSITGRAKDMLGGIVIHPEPVSLVPAFERILQTTVPAGGGRVVASDQSIVASIDAAKMETAMAELVTNSVEITKTPLEISVTIERIKRRQWVRIVYRDNGPGIPKEITARIFEDFFSHHSDGPPGLGLGLSFVRRVVEAHGGTISVSPDKRAGATFIIEMPLTNSRRATNA